LKDGKPLTAKDVEVIVHDDKIVFNIKKPAHALSGKYQIKLKNDQGEDVKDVNVNMQGTIQFRYGSNASGDAAATRVRPAGST